MDLQETSGKDRLRRVPGSGYRTAAFVTSSTAARGTVSSNIDELCKSGGHLYDNIWIKTAGPDSSFGDGTRATGHVHEPPDARIALDDFKRVEDAARSAVAGDFCTAFLNGRMQSAFQKDFVAHWSDHWPVIGELPFGDAPAAAPPNKDPLPGLADDLRHRASMHD